MSERRSRWTGIKRSARGVSDPIAAALAADEVAVEAGRSKAEAMGSPWVEPVDLGVSIDPGAPLPHLIADGQRAETFTTLRHHIITFHDETFDCVRRSWTAGIVDASFEDALAKAVSAVRTGKFHDIAQRPQ